MPSTPELAAAHAQFRQHLGRSRSGGGSGGPGAMRDVKFAACEDSEVAWESRGHGEFTLRATRVLASAGGQTHDQFLEQVLAAFGPQARQHPVLDSSPQARQQLLLQPLAPAAWPPSAPARGAGPDAVVLRDSLLAVQGLLQQLAGR